MALETEYTHHISVRFQNAIDKYAHILKLLCLGNLHEGWNMPDCHLFLESCSHCPQAVFDATILGNQQACFRSRMNNAPGSCWVLLCGSSTFHLAGRPHLVPHKGRFSWLLLAKYTSVPLQASIFEISIISTNHKKLEHMHRHAHAHPCI